MKIDENSEQLKAALEGATARIVITTLQKFPVVAKLAAEEGGAVAGQRFAVIVDEAHSSTTGESTVKLKAVLGETVTGEAGTYLEAAEAAEALHEAGRPDAADLIALSAADRGYHFRTSRSSHSPPRRSRARLSCSASGPLTPRASRCASRSTSTRCGRPSRRASSSTCSPTTRPTGPTTASQRRRRRPRGAAGKAGAVLARYVSPAPEQPGAEGRGDRRALPRQAPATRSTAGPRPWS